LAVSIISAVSTLIYPLAFCKIGVEGNGRPSSLELMGWNLQLQPIFGVLTHTASLYIGPFVTVLMQVYSLSQRNSGTMSLLHLFDVIFVKPVISPYFNPIERWGQVRNIIVAPLSEEIVFRGCMLPPLLASGLGPITASFVAPIFFGVAHAHHAVLKLQEGMKPANVAIVTTFQFMYTTLFGCYAAYVFLRTGSILAVFASHAFCNSMGLPDLSFLSKRGGRYSRLYRHRVFIMGAYLFGVAAFLWGFRSDFLLKLPSRLPQLIHDGIG
jgi:membrane protease YdiL (CAAX protease family)